MAARLNFFSTPKEKKDEELQLHPRERWIFTKPSRPLGVDTNSEGTLLVSSHEDGYIQLFNLKTCRKIHEAKLPYDCGPIYFGENCILACALTNKLTYVLNLTLDCFMEIPEKIGYSSAIAWGNRQFITICQMDKPRRGIAGKWEDFLNPASKSFYDSENYFEVKYYDFREVSPKCVWKGCYETTNAYLTLLTQLSEDEFRCIVHTYSTDHISERRITYHHDKKTNNFERKKGEVVHCGPNRRPLESGTLKKRSDGRYYKRRCVDWDITDPRILKPTDPWSLPRDIFTKMVQYNLWHQGSVGQNDSLIVSLLQNKFYIFGPNYHYSGPNIIIELDFKADGFVMAENRIIFYNEEGFRIHELSNITQAEINEKKKNALLQTLAITLTMMPVVLLPCILNYITIPTDVVGYPVSVSIPPPQQNAEATCRMM